MDIGSWFGKSKSETKYDTLDLWREVYGSTPSWAGENVSLDEALRMSTAFACGRVIAEDCAKLPLKLLQQTDSRTSVVSNHPIAKLLRRPNTMQTLFEFVETLLMHLVFAGNAFVWTPRVSGRVDQLWLFEPGWVTVNRHFQDSSTYDVRSADGKIQMQGLDASEVWHVRGPSWCSYLGLNFVVLARNALGLTMAIERTQSSLQRNEVRTPGILSMEGTLTEDQYKALRKYLVENHGRENKGIPMIVDHAAKWMSNSMSNSDAELAKMRAFQVEEVCRFFRVHPIMVQHSDGQAGYASIEQRFIAHGVQTIQPWITRLEHSGNRHLLTEAELAQGYYMKFNEKALLRTTSKDQSDVLARDVLVGTRTRNEARQLMDLDPLPGLDEPLTPRNVFAGDAREMQEDDSSGGGSNPEQPPGSGDEV